jgi:hypothetical protein
MQDSKLSERFSDNAIKRRMRRVAHANRSIQIFYYDTGVNWLEVGCEPIFIAHF